MFSFAPPSGDTPAKRNASRDNIVGNQLATAIGALEGALSDLRTLQRALNDEDWRDRSKPGAGYHRAEFVGRQFDATHHQLRYFHDAEALALCTAGGYETEEKGWVSDHNL